MVHNWGNTWERGHLVRKGVQAREEAAEVPPLSLQRVELN